MRHLLLPLACLAALSGCRKPASTASSPAPAPTPTLLVGTFADAPGSWWAPHGKGSFRLEVKPKGSGLEYSFHSFEEPVPPTGKTGNRGSAPITFPSWSPDWFIYAADTGNPKILWFYGSSRRLWYTTLKDKISDPPVHRVIDEKGKRLKGSKTPPYAVIQRLPADLRKLFPDVEAPVERPAF